MSQIELHSMNGSTKMTIKGILQVRQLLLNLIKCLPTPCQISSLWQLLGIALGNYCKHSKPVACATEINSV